MSSAATSWSCTISLRSESSFSEVAIEEIAFPSPATPRRSARTRNPIRAPPRIFNSTTQQFGSPITDKTKVELWLRRAQGAILSTDADKSQWLNKSAEEIKQAIEDKTGMREFTEDTIVVDIQDPNATDLSFVDLPGKNSK
jgi:hypothetical protein